MKRILFLIAAGVLCASAGTLAASDADIYQALRTGERLPVELLLEQGLSPNHRDANGNTLLMRATLYGRTDLLSFLIDKGSEVNATNNAGATALMRSGSRSLMGQARAINPGIATSRSTARSTTITTVVRTT